MHLVAANVGLDKKLPQNQPIQLAFDRLLLPDTVIRQSFILVDSFNQPLNPAVTYDPVTRVVTLSNPDPNDTSGTNWLKVDQPYKIVFFIPQGADDQSGIRAIDRATLDPSQAGQLGFQVAPPNPDLPAETQMSFCRDVLPIFSTRCSASTCHGAPAQGAPGALTTDGTTRPAAGLVLETSDGVRNTALRRVANGSNVGALAGEGRSPGRVFGVDMPIIAPGNPSNSWLLYKLMLAPAPDADGGVLQCNGQAPAAPLGPTTAYLPLGDDERARLSDHVRGNQMPYPPRPGTGDKSENLTFDELERIRAWIAQGANVDSCGACGQ